MLRPACIALMSLCSPMLRMTLDCSSASAFMLAARSSLARAASITPASALRLRCARSVPPTDTTTIVATSTPKATGNNILFPPPPAWDVPQPPTKAGKP